MQDDAYLGLASLAAAGCGFAFAFALYAIVRFPSPDQVVTIPLVLGFGATFVTMFVRRRPWAFALAYPLPWIEFGREAWSASQSDAHVALFLLILWLWGPYSMGLPLWSGFLLDWMAARKAVPSD